MEIPSGKGEIIQFNKDDQYRANSNLDSLTKLKPIFGTRAITAGNAPGLNYQSAAILVTSRSKANELGLEIRGNIESIVSIAVKPDRIAEAPGIGIANMLDNVSMRLEEIDILEINEAFYH
ncbi:MAG: hypothetical protein HN945_25395 [Deltaproteobacteria bacterium]|jgi:acetyl-CoA C-acetyltransferase|nr:hypothetical protein [Deltaproteobacteria bacterium]MBT4642535.1 hypothetical protein [Deltaproteobacteria bacterium]MBT7155795.1 hypothetical protein [Deltaproteobacteria bacterium]